MGDALKVGIYQFNIVWENIIENRLRFEKFLRNLKYVPDLLIVPEMYTTGFSIKPTGINIELLIEHPSWQLELSKKYKVSIIGSAIVPENSNFKNRLIYTKPDGNTDFYDKRHLFLSERNNGYYTAGNKRKIFELRGIRIMPQICYDLRFPVWSRNNLNYQVLIYVANWPSVRDRAWRTLLPARAIENQSYVIGVNRVGVDGNNLSYIGGSTVIDPTGKALVTMGDKEEYAKISLSMSELKTFRKEFPVSEDADNFKIQIE